MSKKTTFEPTGLITAFNELGKHPDDMVSFINEKVRDAYIRLGIETRFPHDQKVLLDALDVLANRSSEFTGHHIPCEITKRVLTDVLFGTFIQYEKCNFSGLENFEEARGLIKNGSNVLIIQNHTSPLDALIPLIMIHKKYPEDELPSVVTSQVFEYARITGIVTSGVEKFPVFQPKHMKRFMNAENAHVVQEMICQNMKSLRALRAHAELGGKMIFLYPERDRNTKSMGVPEPLTMKVVELLKKSSRELFVLPTFVSGLDTIFPNKPGVNELDEFFNIIQVGYGNFHCGKPVRCTDVSDVAESIKDKGSFVSNILGKSFCESVEKINLTTMSLVFLHLIAKLSPDNEMKGIYSSSLFQHLQF